VNVSSGGNNALPNNFFDTLSYLSPDFTWTPGTANALTISIEGTYLINIRYDINTIPAGAKLDGVLGLNRAGTITYKQGQATFCDGSVMANSSDGVLSSFLMYLLAGDVIFPCTSAAGNYNNAITGDSSGSSAYFEATLVNRSLT
jgi:hypothetical protein